MYNNETQISMYCYCIAIVLYSMSKYGNFTFKNTTKSDSSSYWTQELMRNCELFIFDLKKKQFWFIVTFYII